MKIMRLLFLFLAIAVPSMAAKMTALDRYVAKPDPAYRYNLVRTHKLKGATVFVINMTSQRFLTRKEVDRPEWKHWLTIIRPDKVRHTTGLLVIGGSSNNRPAPKPGGPWLEMASALAHDQGCRARHGHRDEVHEDQACR